MTLPSPDKTPPYVSFPTGFQRSSGVLIGLVLTFLAATLILTTPLLNLEIHATLAGLVCFVLYVFSSLWDEKTENSTWTSYRHLSLMTAWQIVGLLPTVLLALAGLGLTILMRLRYGKSAKFWEHNSLDTFKSARVSLLVQGSLLGVAALIYRILVNIPAQLVILPVLVALIAGYSASHCVEYLLNDPHKIWPVQPLHANQRLRLLTEIALLPLVITLPLIFAGSGLGVFAIIVLMVAAYAQRYHQTTAAARESAYLYNQSAAVLRKLALVNRMAQNAMFNVDQPIALRTACQTAATIIQADHAAIFLIQPEQNRIQLAESIGFSAQQQAFGYNLAYKPPLPTLNTTYAIGDTTVSQDTSLAANFHQSVGVRALALVPLRSGNLELGYLAVYHDQPHVHKPMELELLEILAGQLAAALDNIQLLQALELHAFELSHLVYLSRVATSSPQLEKVAAELADVLRQITAMDWATLGLREEQSGQMSILGISGNGKPVGGSPSSLIPYIPETARLAEQPSQQLLSFHVGQGHISDELHTFMESYGLVSLVIAPLIANNQLMGFILLGAVRMHRLSTREEQMLETATNQLANQLANLQLYQRTNTELQQQLNQLALIEDIVQRISSSHNFNTIIDDVFEAAIKSTHADMVDLALLTEADDFWVIERYYEDGASVKHVFNQRKDEGILGKVQRTGEMILTPDNSAVSDYLPSGQAVYRSSLAVPLNKDGATVGVLNVESKQADFFNRSQADFLKNLGGHAIISIDNARLLEELQHQINTLTSLRELSLEIATATDTDSVSRAVLKTAMRLTHGQYAVIFHYDGQTVTPVEKIESGQALSAKPQNGIFQDIAQRAATSREVQAVENVVVLNAESNGAAPLYPSLIAAPITRGDQIHEVLCVAFTEEQHFESRDYNTLTLLAIQAAGHLENAALHERIRQGSNRMRAILDSTRDGVILLDFRGKLIEVNPAAQRLLGINLNEHINESFVDTLLRHIESDGDQQAGYSRDELKTLARIQRLEPEGITRREFSRQTSPTTITYVEEIGSTVLDENDHMMGRLLVLRDITEEKMVEVYRDEVTGMAVHDLRSPLAAIVSAQKIAQDNLERADGKEAVKQALNASLTSADKLMTLVNSLLDIRKGKEMTLDRSPNSIEELIESAWQTLQPTAQKHNIPAEFKLPDDLPEVFVDGDKMRRVLINLVDNALRYTPAGKPIQISVERIPQRGKLVVRIADSGPGIPPKERDKIFEQYWQVKENRPLRGSKGSGIGLTFCQKVLDAHGERIWVEDESPLPGACFAFTLPVCN